MHVIHLSVMLVHVMHDFIPVVRIRKEFNLIRLSEKPDLSPDPTFTLYKLNKFRKKKIVVFLIDLIL